MSTATQHAFLVRLLFDEELREAFFDDPEATASREGLAPDDLDALKTIDRTGLELDAAMRRDYLMSALCRPYPLTAAALGSLPGGPRRLAAFLTSPRLLADPSTRSEAFGEHLSRLLSFGTLMPPVWDGLIESVLAFERGLVREAAALRRSVEQGGAVPVVTRQRGAGPVALPAFTFAVELPVPTALIRGALEQVGAESAWHHISAGRLSSQRLLTVARADPLPVTLLARATVVGTPAGSVVEVTHLTAELHGRRAAFFAALDGTRPLSDFPPAEQSALERLVEAGLLETR